MSDPISYVILKKTSGHVGLVGDMKMNHVWAQIQFQKENVISPEFQYRN